MALPLIATGLFGIIGAAGALTKGFTSKYEQDFDYDYYNSDNPRFYNANLVSMLNPEGFDRELFNEAMVEYHKIKPMN